MPRRSLKGRYSCWRQKAADRSASSWRLCIWDGVSASGSCGFSNLAISCAMNAALRSLVELWSGQSSPRMSRIGRLSEIEQQRVQRVLNRAAVGLDPPGGDVHVVRIELDGRAVELHLISD